MRQYLVVANHTLGGQELVDVVRERLARGPATFWVLVPATPTTHMVNDFNALSCAFPVDPDVLPGPADAEARERASAAAERNLVEGLQRLREAGARVEGAVVDADPLRAIQHAVGSRSFDEIILSTLRPGISRWLALDLPARVRRRIDVPLTVITTRESHDLPT